MKLLTRGSRNLLAPQMLKVMKLTFILLTAAFLQVSANGHSQTVTFSGKDVPITKVFAAIKNQTGYVFFYDASLLQEAKPVTLDVKNVSLEAVLQETFNDQPLTWSIVNKTITIIRKPMQKVKEQFEKNLPPPPIDVKGRVVNENGEPVPGATITAKGTKNATSTDANGYFTLNGLDENATLVITGVNIETYEVKVGGRNDLAMLTVKTKVTEGEDVMIKTGYYDVRRQEATGNISRVDAKTIEKQPVSNPLQALQGRVPGLNILQQNGIPGSNFKVQIRGRNSIVNGNDPLYIIDGVPFSSGTLSDNATALSIMGIGGNSPLNSISPADIESIEILKDADATAIYGSRGANGVILITTKKGKGDKTRAEINVSTGFSEVPETIQMLNTKQYLEMRREAFRNANRVPQPFHYDVNGVWDTTRNTDWQKALIGGKAHRTTVQASVTGGSANTSFLFSVGYEKQGTVFPGDFTVEKKSSHFSLAHTSSDQKFRANFSFNYVVNNSDLPITDLTSIAVPLPPDAPALYNSDGKLNWENSTWSNPLAYTETKYKQKTNNLISNAVLRYKILPDLEVMASVGLNDFRITERNSTPSTFFNPGFNPTPAWASLYTNDGSVNSWIFEPQINWEKRIGEGMFSALFGTTFQENITDKIVKEGFEFVSDALVENIDAAAIINVKNFTSNQYRYNAFYGRVNYNYKKRYIINVTARRDGSSRFGPEKQFGNFGAAGLAWLFYKEQLIEKKLPFLSYGKFRMSYGTSGNDQIGDYRYLNTYSPGSQYQGINALNPSRLFSPDFAWETNKKLEAGLETGFFKNRIMLAASYYRNRSSNQLVEYPLAMTTGFAGVLVNLGATVQNLGWEFEINTVNIESNSFKWSTSINVTIPRNKLISFPGLDGSSYATQYEIGQPLDISKMYHFTGVDPQTGLSMFEDMNSDGTISFSDQLAIVKTGQKYYGGINNNFSYKSWQLDVFFQFVKQSRGNYWSGAGGWPGLNSYNLPTEVLNTRWQKPGDIASFPFFTTRFTSAFSNYTQSDAVVDDASFIRLKNVSLSFQLPEKWSNKIKGRLYLQGQNLLTITNYFGMDPENGNSLVVPPLRTITGGIQLIF